MSVAETGDGGGGGAAGGSEVTVNWPGSPPPRGHQALTAAPPFHSRYSLNATRPKRQAAALLHLAQHAGAPPVTFLVIISPPVLSPPPPSRGIGARVASAALVRGQSDLSRFVGTEELFFPLRMGSLDGGGGEGRG